MAYQKSLDYTDAPACGDIVFLGDAQSCV